MDRFQAFGRALIKDKTAREAVAVVWQTFEEGAASWKHLPPGLRAEIDQFEAQMIASAYALALGGSPNAVARRQDFLVRTAITAILFPLQAFEDRLLRLIETRGVPALFQHVVRELIEESGDTKAVLDAANACRLAAFQLEDMLQADETANPAQLLLERDEILGRLWSEIDVEAIPYAWVGVAMLWVTSLVDLGMMNNADTTDHLG